MIHIAARHQHVVTDYETLDHDMSLNSAGFYKPMKERFYHQPGSPFPAVVCSRHSPMLELQISPVTTPISSPASSTWSPQSSDSCDQSHNVAHQQQHSSMWGSTVTDQQPSYSAATKRHCRSVSEASQLQDLNAYHRRPLDDSQRDVQAEGISPKSAFKTTRSAPAEEDSSLDSSPPSHENGIIVFGTKTPQNNSQQASSGGHRYTCQDCNKTFARPSSLRVHSYSHTGEKPYACPDTSCGRRFSVCSNLRRHMRVHRLRHDPPQWKPKASIDSSSSPCRATSV